MLALRVLDKISLPGLGCRLRHISASLQVGSISSFQSKVKVRSCSCVSAAVRDSSRAHTASFCLWRIYEPPLWYWILFNSEMLLAAVQKYTLNPSRVGSFSWRDSSKHFRCCCLTVLLRHTIAFIWRLQRFQQEHLTLMEADEYNLGPAFRLKRGLMWTDLCTDRAQGKG